MQICKDERMEKETETEAKKVYETIQMDSFQITQRVREGFEEGKFSKKRKKSMDNFELVPNKHEQIA